MSLMDWAENEVKIAIEREKQNSEPNAKIKEWTYGAACYKSALKAYKTLCKDGHSGLSWHFTFDILKRLCNNQPLTPIVDTPDIWNDVSINRREYQCKRASSLFKNISDEGVITYHDVERVMCIDIHKPRRCYYSGLVSGIVDELYPIRMPYMPGPPIKAYCEEFLTDEENGDFDTVGVLYLVMPDGSKVDIFKYYKDAPGMFFEEITKNEYYERKMIANKRIEQKQKTLGTYDLLDEGHW